MYIPTAQSYKSSKRKQVFNQHSFCVRFFTDSFPLVRGWYPRYDFNIHPPNIFASTKVLYCFQVSLVDQQMNLMVMI